MYRRIFNHQVATVLASALMALHLPALAKDEPPDAMIQRLSNSVLDNIRSDNSIKSESLSFAFRRADPMTRQSLPRQPEPPSLAALA